MNNLKSPKCPTEDEWLSKRCRNHSAEESAAIKMENYEDHERQRRTGYNITWGTKAEYKAAYTSQLQLYLHVKADTENKHFYYSSGDSG